MSRGEKTYWKRVLATAAVYIAAGWAGAEALLTVVDRFGFPAWSGTLIMALFVAVLPVTLYLVWRTAGVERKASAASIIGSLIFLIVATAALFWFTRPAPLPAASAVAIVPCEFEGDVEQAYRAEGLAEDVHARLSRVDSVKISSWNSSLFVRDKDYEPAQIAEVLKIDRLVQCRMLSSSGRIELSAEVIDPLADEVLWKHTYDFAMADLGTVVKELAGTLLDVLGTTAEAAEMKRVDKLGTFSPEAYDLFLQARAGGSESLIRQALEIDPNYAEALVLHATLYLDRALTQEFADMQEPRAWLEEARTLSQSALDLDSGVWEARQILASVCKLLHEYYREDCTPEKQNRLMEEECEVRGDTAEGWACRHLVWAMYGGDESTALERWLELEPTSLDANGQYLAELWASQGRYEEAMAVFDTMRALEPDATQMLGLISNLLRTKGRLDEVLAWRFGMFEDRVPEGPWRLARLATDYLNLGLYEPATEIGLKTWETRRASATHFMPMLWARSGQAERAAAAMEWQAQTREEASGSPSDRLHLAEFYMATLRDFERAQELYREALAEQDLQELCEQAEDCVISNALNLVQIERTLGHDPEAGAWLRVAEDLAGQMPPDENTDRMWPQLRIAQGRHEEAIDLLRQSVFEWSSDEDLVYPIYFLETEAMFDPLRELPGFQRLLDDYQAYLEPMRQRVLEARESGGWEALRNSTYQWARDESG